jgi:hypothetical protein
MKALSPWCRNVPPSRRMGAPVSPNRTNSYDGVSIRSVHTSIDGGSLLIHMIRVVDG